VLDALWNAGTRSHKPWNASFGSTKWAHTDIVCPPFYPHHLVFSRCPLRNFWRFSVHHWFLPSCWPRCGWSLADLRRIACKWGNLSVWSSMFFSRWRTCFSGSCVDTPTESIRTPLSMPLAAPQALAVLPQIIKHRSNCGPFALTWTGFSMLLF
jgi:hypothetical protein